MPDVAAVLEANRRFYEAFEATDMDAMSAVWEHGDEVLCTHPGWATLVGWGAVAGSWFALFSNGRPLQFIVTNERATVEGDVAWVACDENILAGATGGTVAAMNLFRRSAAGWRMVAHHGSVVAQR